MVRYLTLTLLFFLGAVFVPFHASALTISPVKMEVAGDPSQILRGELRLFNEQGETKIFYSSIENFEARGESGAPYFLPEREGLATWIRTDGQVILKPKEEKTVPFSIHIPKNAAPGGHFAAILWGTTAPNSNQGGQVAVGGRLGVLILLKVSGDVREGGGLLEFRAIKNFFSSLPITLAYRFNNTGGDRIIPAGEITINNTFGFVSATLPVNKNAGSILPGSARKFEVTWKLAQKNENSESTDTKEARFGFFEMARRQWHEFHFGWYTANMHLVYGATNQTTIAHDRFFIIPWQLLLLMAMGSLAVGLMGKKALGRYNAWIIRHAGVVR